MTVRLCVLADLHHGPPSATKRGDAALELAGTFATFVREHSPDAVLDLGDRITDTDLESDRRRLAEVVEAFGAIGAPILGVDGNHDRDHVPAEENAAQLGRSAGSETRDLGGWRIVLWRADPKVRRTPEGRRFVLPESDFLWLSSVVQQADRPLLIVSHVPVSGHGQTGNYYFENNPIMGNYPEWPRVRALLQRAHVPVVCIAGHVHWNTVTTVDGVAHLTQQSITESFTTQGQPSGAMGLLELGADTVHWRVVGADPFEVTVPVQAPRWVPCLQPFDRAYGLSRESVAANDSGAAE